MGTVRTDLTAQLNSKLRTVKAECTSDELSLAITNAVQAYSERRPRLARLTITWAIGQEEINLPEDWIRMEPVSWGVLNGATPASFDVYDGRAYGRIGVGVVRGVMPGQFRSSTGTAVPAHTIYEGYPPKLVFDSAPITAGSVNTKYLGTHVVSDTDGSTTVPKPDWSLIVLRAVYQVWSDIALERGARPTQFDAGSDGATQRVRMADPEALQKMANSCNAEFLRRVDQPYGVSG